MGYISYKTKTNKTKTQHRKQSQPSIDNTEKLATWDTQVTRRRQTNQKRRMKTESQSRIDNTEKLDTWDTQVTRRRQTKQKHNIENRESTQY